MPFGQCLIGIAGGIIGTYIVTRRMVSLQELRTPLSADWVSGCICRYQSHIGSIAFCRRFGIGSRVAFPAWNRKGRLCNRYVVGFGHGGGNNLYFQDARICSRVERVSFWEYTYRNVVRSRLVCTLYSIASSVVGIVLSLSYRCRVRSRLCFYPAVTGTAYRLYDGCNGVVVCGIDDTVGRHNASFVDVDDSANDRRAFYPTLQDNTLGVGTSYRCRRCVGIVAGLFARRTFRCMYCFFTYCCLCGRALRIKGLSSLCS